MTARVNDDAVLRDEDAPTIPDAWRRWVHPRRGGLTAPAVTGPDEGAVAKAERYAADGKATIDALSDRRRGRDLVDAARRHRQGDANPTGAAVIALLATLHTVDGFGWSADVPGFFADAWTIEHGSAFAACAVVEMESISIDEPRARPRGGEPVTLSRHRYSHPHGIGVHGCARRMRTLLAAAGDADYEEAVERLAGLRDTPRRRALVAHLVPTRHDWVTESCEEWRPRGNEPVPLDRLLMAAGTPGHVATLVGAGLPHLAYAEVVATLVDGLGSDALPVFTHFLDTLDLDKADRQRVLEAVVLLPSDEAFQALLDRMDQRFVRPALLAMMDRFPARALRLLAGAAVAARARGDAEAATAVTELVAGHLLSHPDVVAAVEPELSEEGRAAVTAAGRSDRLPEAPVDTVPPLLAEPPWTRPREAAEPVVIEGLQVAAEPALVWAEGEREDWAVPTASLVRGARYREDTDWEAVVEMCLAGQLAYDDAISLYLDGPEDLIRPVLGAVEEGRYWLAEDVAWVKAVVARFGTDALPLALRAARGAPDHCAKPLLPFLDAEVAAFMAGLLDRARAARSGAVAWFERHGAEAARLLLPAALGKPGKARRRAEDALLLIASRTGDDAVVEAAREHGDQAADAVAALLAGRLERFPATIPEPGEWADPRFLPQVRLRGDERALPLSAVRHLVTMLAMSKPGDVYAGVDVVRDLCDPESLADFSWALFDRWESNGAPPKERWALHQLAWFADDETVRRLSPVIRAWPQRSAHRNAADGVDVLADIGSEVALLHLHTIAEKVKFKALRTKARDKLAEVASGLGLTADRLADRLVPDLGLDDDGGLVLDYGPRRFTVGFDEQLRPYVTDEDGKRRKALPKPGAKDDPELAPAAYTRFSALKKDLRTVASDRIGRLESAMLTRARWTLPELRRLFVEHPLMWHLARRLVWLAETGDGRAVAFRLAEDRTFADVEDEAVVLPEDASVRVPHPIDLGGDVTAWGEIFADYEITQPFPQLGREVHVLADEERASHRLTRFEGAGVPVGAVLGLVGRGWERGEPLDAGIERWISRSLPGGRHIVINLEPGVNAGHAPGSGDQTLARVWISDRPDDHPPRDTHRHTFGELDPVTASEVLADLMWLTGSAS